MIRGAVKDERDATGDDANQRRAADPAASVWVAANAGTGKTKVLIDRVTRLLLAGTRPGAILCLTFTKAAAAEMRQRLDQRLANWAMLDEAGLRRELSHLHGRPIDTEELDPARRLFAAVIDAPGGLRIQTIHAFCESVLKRFPLEARVAPHFSVADEFNQAELIEQAKINLLVTAANRPDLARALAFVVRHVDDKGFAEVMQELGGGRRKLAACLAAHGGIDPAIAAGRAQLGLHAADTPKRFIDQFVAATPAADLRQAATALDRGTATDGERAAKIRTWLDARDRAALLLSDWRGIFLTKEGKPRTDKSLITKGAQTVDGAALGILLSEQDRLVALQRKLKALTVAEASAALIRLGATLLEIYAKEKMSRALMDYDDLILATANLLRHSADFAPWVLYKLDGGLDHILVDEAQDTSPEQWDVIAALAEEFFSGRGATDVARTMFAVGDEKQSIFSFQGADPTAFARLRGFFQSKVRDSGQRWLPVDLEVSRRSVPALLEFIDAVFKPEAARAGLTAGDGEVRHKPSRTGMAGLVELWPPVEPDKADPPAPWYAPYDYLGRASAPAKLARRIAGVIADWLKHGEMLPSQGRKLRAGDIMILVRRRNAFFDEIVRALKAAEVPVAGADRMVLGKHIAVMDLVALGRLALLPDDDLTLATVLKGPLIGLSEDSIFDLCWRRDGRLWATLARRAAERPEWHEAWSELTTILARADYVPPYEFYAEILGARRGRERILARLGFEATDPLDEFLNLALAFERQHEPSLQSFLRWFEAGGAVIKRDLEQGGNAVRVMTVHGAKGLEANVVFLPDTCAKPDHRQDAALLWHEAEAPVPFWPMRVANDEVFVAELRNRSRYAREREYRRLLYVALTRARDRLYVCGWQGDKRPDGCWYDLILPAMAGAPTISLPWGETGWRIATAQDEAPEASRRESIASPAAPLPAWAELVAAPELAPPLPLTPSRPPGDEPVRTSPVGAVAQRKFQRGRLIHRLLQVLPDLPPAARPDALRRFLAAPLHRLDDQARTRIAAEVSAILDDATFAPVFGPGSRAEVALVGAVDGAIVSGQVDRLVVAEDSVLLIDFKSDRSPPPAASAVAPFYLRQLRLYREVLRAIFPGKTVQSALLWTDGPLLMPIADHLLDSAK